MEKKQEKKFKYAFEPQSSFSLQLEMERIAKDIIRDFWGTVRPVLLFCGLLQDDFIRKTLGFGDMRPIYEAAVEKNAERMDLLQDIAFAKGEDFWVFMRDKDCKAKTPLEPGFVFRRIPWAYNTKRILDKVLKSIIVENGALSIDHQTILSESLYCPTDRMRQLYDLAADFCKALKEMDIQRPEIWAWLFQRGEDGSFEPSKRGIMFGKQGGFT